MLLLVLLCASCSTVESNGSQESKPETEPTQDFGSPTRVAALRTRFPESHIRLDIFRPETVLNGQVIVKKLLSQDGNTLELVIERHGGFRQTIPLSSLDPERTISIASATIDTVRGLNGDGEPEVVLYMFMPGAYCCGVITVIFYDSATAAYQASNLLIRNYGGGPSGLISLPDGRPGFRTWDEPYAYEARGVTPTVGISPLQFFRYEDGMIVDVSRDYPDMIREDADYWLAKALNEEPLVSEKYLETSGYRTSDFVVENAAETSLVLTAYLADMCRLGLCEEAWEKVSQVCTLNACGQDILHEAEQALATFGYSE